MNLHRTEPRGTSVTSADSAPDLRIGAAGLVVRDLEREIAFYREVIGLGVVDRSATSARLGVGGVTLVSMEQRPEAIPDDRRRAGLYHIAFLMPERADLARWVRHVAHQSTPIVGMSDHAVSEAIYLDDPEGNGVEVYADRPRQEWQWNGDLVTITTDPLDLDGLVAHGDSNAYDAAPEAMRIGHVHLRVGDVGRAEAFYRDAIGLDVTRRRTGASFLSSGRYHHHVAVNVWHSAGAGPRGDNEAGLAWFAMETGDPAALPAIAEMLTKAGSPVTSVPGGISTRDPFGNRIHLLAPSPG